MLMLKCVFVAFKVKGCPYDVKQLFLEDILRTTGYKNKEMKKYYKEVQKGIMNEWSLVVERCRERVVLLSLMFVQRRDSRRLWRSGATPVRRPSDSVRVREKRRPHVFYKRTTSWMMEETASSVRWYIYRDITTLFCLKLLMVFVLSEREGRGHAGALAAQGDGRMHL